MVVLVFYHYSAGNGEKKALARKLFEPPHLKWEEKPSTLFGRCLELKVPEELNGNMISMIELYLKLAEVVVLLRHPGQVLHWNEGSVMLGLSS